MGSYGLPACGGCQCREGEGAGMEELTSSGQGQLIPEQDWEYQDKPLQMEQCQEEDAGSAPTP